METGHQNEVADDVDDAGHQNKKQGRLAVAQAAEDGSQQVVCHDEEDAGTTDADIAGSQGHGLGGGLHQHRDAARKTDHHDEEHGGEKGKHDGCTADDRADELRLFLTQIPGNEDCDAHGQLGDDEGDEVEHLAAGGDRRQTDGGAEPAHDQQVYRAIGRLQHQCAQDGEHEGSQLFQDAALRKIIFFRSQERFSFRKTLGGMLRWCGWSFQHPLPGRLAGRGPAR